MRHSAYCHDEIGRLRVWFCVRRHAGYRRAMLNDEERIALFLDYENLAIGAREALGGAPFDFRPIADALAERGRVVVRRAYADWSCFDEDRRMLTRAQVELIEIPQRHGRARARTPPTSRWPSTRSSWPSSATTSPRSCIGTGDSDFTPLVHKLRELNKRVIGIGVEASTSALLPPACDEFLFYDRLRASSRHRRPPRHPGPARPAGDVRPPRRSNRRPPADTRDDDLGVLVTQTLTGLAAHTDGPVLASC